uniref:Uncharacterized protein n=1 Tax=Calidris pygmaea TaxID=425635 RepID=A0A8C3JF59_9CHAR
EEIQVKELLKDLQVKVFLADKPYSPGHAAAGTEAVIMNNKDTQKAFKTVLHLYTTESVFINLALHKVHASVGRIPCFSSRSVISMCLSGGIQEDFYFTYEEIGCYHACFSDCVVERKTRS